MEMGPVGTMLTEGVNEDNLEVVGDEADGKALCPETTDTKAS